MVFADYRSSKGLRTLRREDVSGWIILRWILERYVEVFWNRLISIRVGISEGLL
jgi:hypothetical protein